MKGYEDFSVERCGSCEHFIRHYVRFEDDSYVPISYGHCIFPKMKKRRDEERCPRWSAAKTAPGV